jgi:hypothetical protein
MVNPGLQPVEQQMADSVGICGSSLFRVGSGGVKSVPRRSSILTETEEQVLNRRPQRGIAATTMNHRIGVSAYGRIGVRRADVEQLTKIAA